MFLEKLTCVNCGNEIKKDEVVLIQSNARQLNGLTNLKEWAKNQAVYCSTCKSELYQQDS
ncbi:hypothetical protein [Staphylococcus massiliensis]|uniref:Uncharacterized protein n=1 Tax=Staphylococcus massiliensis S46 TaxID=1229783 RepID=K9ASU4_9STAP|nr:hypothetical protein [Staphylococcus massiliensis]EKU50364.1 hypothetical protein C273_00035 [Staphylococcus massiliensis S46]MCG3400579.1 hypothetical protein [Staphylococcus massiliensis]MCG3401428.1 hypothetical protein [Staphylococcus massiliensis]MCG3411789.1 hypothetical protein [Staphylococcus massiliensis]PNZ98141.1 hypothetical protein CD133_09315 [Staphylococcus massiliensis CCUG 55927]